MHVAVKVIMPQAGQDLETGTVTHWLKAEGDAVTKGEPIVQIETEKISVDVEAPASGILLRIVVPDATETPIFSTIAVIGQPGEDVSGIE
jgi:pyruvate/2-oxoglutarate dehydrogenase complex dihydrolipoamide acyltransferase (E2) component